MAAPPRFFSNAVLYRWLGVKVGPVTGYGALSEQYVGGVLPGLDTCRVPHRGLQWHEIRAVAATVCSRFIDARDRWHVGGTIYANAWGGRVAVYASVGDFAGGTFGSHARLRWLHGLLRLVGAGTVSTPCRSFRIMD